MLYTLKSFGISGNSLNLLKHYLTDRSERVLLNGQCSNWQPILAGVPQGSILGPLFFLMYINDLPDGLKSNVKLFADDTSLFSVVKNKEESASDITNDLDMISNGHITRKCHSIQTLKTHTRGIILQKRLKYNSSNYSFQQCSGTKS